MGDDWAESEAPRIICGCSCVLLLSLLLLEAIRTRPRLAALLSSSSLPIAIGASANLAYVAFGSLSPPRESLRLATSATMHDMMYYLILPPIIFEAGYTMRKHRFFANFGTILLYAILGTALSIVATGSLVYLFSSCRIIRTELTLSQALLFGSLISSTDPVATISILRTSNAPQLLGDLIFGESALNDALAIVFFNLFRKRCQRERDLSEHTGGPPDAGGPVIALLEVVADLFLTFGGSLVLGVMAGLLCALMLRRLGLIRMHRPSVELSALLCVLFGIYSIAEMASLSGILALFFTGTVMRHYASYNLSSSARSAALVLFRTLGTISEISLALVMGVSIVDYAIPPGHIEDEALSPPAKGEERRQSWDLAFALLIVPMLLASRAINVFPLSLLANRCRSPNQRVSTSMQVVMWWSGLRGAVSFALAMTLDDRRESRMVLDVGTAAPLVTTTLIAILGSNTLLAPLTAPLIRFLRMEAATAHSTAPLLLTAARSVAMARRSQSLEGAHPTVSTSASLETICEVRDGDTEACGRSFENQAEQTTLVQATNCCGAQSASFSTKQEDTSAIYRRWHYVDEKFMKPVFGGRGVQTEQPSSSAHDANCTPPDTPCLTPGEHNR